MSKLTKFINHPRWFFKDTFKKQEENIAIKVDSLNAHLKRIGFSSQLDMHSLEHKFINSAVKVTHHNFLSQQVIRLITNSQDFNQVFVFDAFGRIKDLLNHNTPSLLIKHSIEISLSPIKQKAKEIQVSSEINEAYHKGQDDLVESQFSEIDNSIPLNWSARTKQFHKRLR